MFCGQLTVLAQFLLCKSELLLHTLTVSSPMLLCHFLNSLIQLRTVLRGHTTRAVLKFRFFDSSTVWRKVTTCEQSTNVLTNANLKIMTRHKIIVYFRVQISLDQTEILVYIGLNMQNFQ